MAQNKNNLKKKCLDCLEKTYCRVQSSPLGGVGVFAIRDIPKGTDIFYGCLKPIWIRFNKNELAHLDQGVKEMIDDFLPTVNLKDFYVPVHGLNGMDISYFINHSNKPNCQTPKNSFGFFTARKVKKGEELTVNYGSYDPYFKATKKFENLTS
ncbi:MAG: SET domain-containing protein [Patescibacteria group bacterium]